MITFWGSVIASIATGAFVNEICDLSPWLARRLVRRAARMWAWSDTDLARTYEEEWAALVDDCPGKLSKLLLALRFLARAACSASAERLGRIDMRSSPLFRRLSDRFDDAADSDTPVAAIFASSVFPLGLTALGIKTGRLLDMSLSIAVFLLLGTLFVWHELRSIRARRIAYAEFLDEASLECGTTFIAAFRAVAEEHGSRLTPFEIKYRNQPCMLGIWPEVLVEVPIPNTIFVLRPIDDEFVLLYRDLGQPAAETMVWVAQDSSFIPASELGKRDAMPFD